MFSNSYSLRRACVCMQGGFFLGGVGGSFICKKLEEKILGYMTLINQP